MVEISTYMIDDKAFFNKSSFFNDNVRNKIENKSGVNFGELVEWCSTQCYNRPQKIAYIGNSKYVSFFLFFVFRHKETLEKLWSVVAEYVDKSYRIRLLDNEIQFKQYLWELYLKYYLINNGYSLMKSLHNKGPDIEFNNANHNVYIECVVPGVGDNDFKVPAMEMNGCGPIPFEQLKCRLKFAIFNKIQKYKEYIDKELVKKDDKLIIAVNTSDLDLYGEFMDAKDLLMLDVCRENNIFEDNLFLDGIIYNHKSIFEYNSEFKIFYISRDCSLIENQIVI